MENNLFKTTSTILYPATKYFSKQVKEEFTTIYIFLKTVDDFVNSKPPNRKEFFAWNTEWQENWNGEVNHNEDIDEFMELSYKYQFERKWVESYFASKKFDLEKRKCTTLADTIWYMYGSAEVTGLMFCRILKLPEEAEKYAALLGRAIQYINFIRDIKEHILGNRQYLPLPNGITTFTRPKTTKERELYKRHIKKLIQEFYRWLAEAKKGLGFLPYKERVGIMTAMDTYVAIAKKIEKKPLIVFEKKITISKQQLQLFGALNYVKARTIASKKQTYAEKIYAFK